MKEKVSIIVPVYQAEPYLRDCLDSVLAQSHSCLEVLLIDDGSSDGSPAICDAYAEKDPRCVAVHKENGGASSARNAGLERATGDYIVFVDSDDRLPADSVEKLYRAITGSDAQYAAGAIYSGSGKPYPRLDREIHFQKDAPDLLNYLTVPGSYSPYAKIFDASVIRSHGLRYDESLKCAEDALFLRQYFRYCSRIRLISDTVYYYNRENASSLSKKFYPDYARYFAEKLKALEALLAVLDLTETQKNAFLKERAVHGMRISTNHYLSCGQKDAAEAYICGTMELFSPWLSLDAGIGNKDLRVWWNKHARQIETRAINEYIRSAVKEQKQSSAAVRCKALVKKVLGI